MKFTIETAHLVKALDAASACVPSRTTILTLECARLVAEGRRLTITTNNLDSEFTIILETGISRPGAALVDFEHLHRWVKTLAEGSQVEIELIENTAQNYVALRCGRASQKIQTLAVEDFPAFRRPDGNSGGTVAASSLAGIFDQLLFAVSTEETRYYLNGIHFAAESGGIGSTATDGHKLGRAFLAGQQIMLPDAGIILPRFTIKALRPILDTIKGNVLVRCDANAIGFAWDYDNKSLEGPVSAEFLSRLIEGTFPDWRRVVPREGEITVTALRKTLADTIRRVFTANDDRDHSAVKFAIGNNEIVLTHQSTGQRIVSTDSLECRTKGAIDIGFNGRYVLEILRALEGEEIEIAMSDASAPSVWRTAGSSSAIPPEDTSDFVVLMPMRV